MISQSDIQQMLADSFADQMLSKAERAELRGLTEQLAETPELRSFARNKAFEMVRDDASTGHVSVRALGWLERVVKTLDNADSFRPPEVQHAFAPGEQCRRLIQQEISRSHRQIDICVFTISDNQLRDAILAAHQRKVRIRILSDQDKANDLGSDVDYLARQGVNVLLDSSPWHMHHKFALFDGKRLLNGSFNWTRSATEKNQENLALTDNPKLVKAFVDEFERLWKQHSNA